MAWTEIEKRLKELSNEEIVGLLKGLHGLSSQNKAWLAAKVLPVFPDVEYLEKCYQKIVHGFVIPLIPFR